MRARRAGFTLIEIMIALAMVATVLALAYSSVATTTRTIEHREVYARALHRADFVLRHLTDNLQSAHLDAAVYYRMEDPTQLFDGGADALLFWTHAPAQTRRIHHGMLHRAEYRLRPAESTEAGGMELAFEAYTDLAELEDIPIAQWVMPVETVLFEYHDGEGWLGGWDLETEERLPRAIRISVAVRSAGDALLEVQTVVALHPTRGTQITPPESAEQAIDESPLDPAADVREDRV